LEKEDLEILKEVIEDEKEIKKISGPIKIILGIFLVLIILLWMIPYYYIKADPRPNYIPEIDEVFNGVDINVSEKTVNSPDEFLLYIDSRNPEVKAVADKISSMACDYSEEYIICQSKAIFLFVRDNFDYVRDPSFFEYVKGPIESLNNQGGDCDDASILLASLLGSIGVKTRLVFVPGHVYIEAYLPEASSKYKEYRGEDWVSLDGTCKTCEFGELSFSTAKAQKTYVG